MPGPWATSRWQYLLVPPCCLSYLHEYNPLRSARRLTHATFILVILRNCVIRIVCIIILKISRWRIFYSLCVEMCNAHWAYRTCERNHAYTLSSHWVILINPINCNNFHIANMPAHGKKISITLCTEHFTYMTKWLISLHTAYTSLISDWTKLCTRIKLRTVLMLILWFILEWI